MIGRLFSVFLLLYSLGAKAESYPASFINGLIITQATIDGQQVNVILDSGAPGLVLNQSYYNEDNASEIPCSGINGSFLCKTRMIQEWRWLGTSAKKTRALVSDLSFLEDALQQKIHAIIGLSVLSEYYVTIDLDRQQITLEKEMDSSLESTFSRFNYVNHLPVIQCRVNGQKKILGLDTGSAANYLFDFNAKTSAIQADGISPVLVVSNGNMKDVKHRIQLNLEVPEGEVPVPASFIVDLNDKGQFRHDAFDGILGQEFLSDYNLIIHPGKQKILFQPRAENHLVIE